MLDVIVAVTLRLMVKPFTLFITLIVVLDVKEPYFVYGSWCYGTIFCFFFLDVVEPYYCLWFLMVVEPYLFWF